MKILMLCESFPESESAELTGGVETGDYYTAKELSQRHDLLVITAARAGVQSVQTINGIRVKRFGKPVTKISRETLSARLSFAWNVGKINASNFDLIYASNFFTHALAAILSLRFRKPAVIKTADVYLGSWIKNTGLITGIIGELIERATLSYPWKAVISWSESTANKIQKLGFSQNLTVIGGAADLELCQSLKVIKYKQPTLICVSRLVGYKRVADVIKAFDLVLREIPKAQLKIVGTGPEQESLEKLAKILGISQSIEFVGFVESHREVLKYLKKSHLLIHASEVEGFGLVTLESLACGVPYVHSNLNVTREITDQGKGGEYFELGDLKNASEKIVQLLQSKKLYNHKVKEAKIVTKKHSWSTVAKQTEKIFHQAIQKA